MLMAGCSAQQYPWSPRPVAVVNRPAEVISRSCPPQLMNQAHWLMTNISRVRLGSPKLEVTAVLGQPVRAESFMLTDGAMVEVLFYHTAGTVCRRPDLDAGLMPFVFQNNRLLGYGQNYYHDFIVPSLRPLAMKPRAPQQPVLSRAQATMQLPQDLARGYNGSPYVLQEDLPRSAQNAAMPARMMPVQMRDDRSQPSPASYQPVSYRPDVYRPAASAAYPQQQDGLGRGQPLR